MKIRRRLPAIVMFTFLLRALTGLVSAAEPLDLGATAPALKGTNQDGKTVDLAEQYKKGYVLVYFYPKAGTPGCTAEACSLRDAFADLTKLNLTVIGVSHDTVADQKAFATKQNLQFNLLADPKSEIYTAFGVTGFNRQSFIVKDGKIVWRELKASTAEQANDVKKAVADLTSVKPVAATPAASAPAASTPAPAQK